MKNLILFIFTTFFIVACTNNGFKKTDNGIDEVVGTWYYYDEEEGYNESRAYHLNADGTGIETAWLPGCGDITIKFHWEKKGNIVTMYWDTYTSTYHFVGGSLFEYGSMDGTNVRKLEYRKK